MFRGDTMQDRETQTMDETEEEDQASVKEFIRHTVKRQTKIIEARKRDKTQLLERIQSQEEELRTAREKETKLKEKIEKLEKECNQLKISLDDALADKEKELKGRRQELKELQENIEDNERALRESKDELGLKERALEESEEELRSEERVKRLNDENQSLTMELSEKEEEIQRNKEKLEASSMETIQHMERIRGQEEELVRARESETKLKEEIKKLEKECTELKEKGKKFYDTLAAKSNKLRETREQLEVLQDQIENKEKALNESKEELSCKENALKESEEMLRLKEMDLKESQEHLSGLKEDLDIELHLHVQKLHKSDKKAKTLDDENKRLNSRLSEKEKEIHRLTERLSEKEEEIKRLKEEIAKFKGSLEDVKDDVTGSASECSENRDDVAQSRPEIPEFRHSKQKDQKMDHWKRQYFDRRNYRRRQDISKYSESERILNETIGQLEEECSMLRIHCTSPEVLKVKENELKEKRELLTTLQKSIESRDEKAPIEERWRRHTKQKDQQIDQWKGQNFDTGKYRRRQDISQDSSESERILNETIIQLEEECLMLRTHCTSPEVLKAKENELKEKRELLATLRKSIESRGEKAPIEERWRRSRYVQDVIEERRRTYGQSVVEEELQRITSAASNMREQAERRVVATFETAQQCRLS
ncbi:trichohyalin-like isoform X2 [Mya arenaria]|uniref:trichohyalin-like isoform X2 n=1 Tax=Mya arenaria TaxID=6604 RepID=UPI0022E3E92A|nr:trichohyalin-like isoform X2 [Mya arenaria]